MDQPDPSAAAPALPRRRWSRLSLRATLVLVVLVALPLAWKVNRARRQAEATAAVLRLGGFVHYADELAPGPGGRGWTPTPGGPVPGPRALRAALGDDYFRDVAWVSLVYDTVNGRRVESALSGPAALPHLAGFPALDTLLMQGDQGDDESIGHLTGLPNLESLYFWDATSIGDVGAAKLARCRSLKYLHLDKSRMTDEGVIALASLPELEGLSIQSTTLTDRSMAALGRMPKLKSLHVGLLCTGLTDAGLKELARSATLEILDIQEAPVTEQGIDDLIRSVPTLKEIWWKGQLGRKGVADRRARMAAIHAKP